VELQEDHLSPSQAHCSQFEKWFMRADIAARYYSRGGQKYLRDSDLKDLDLSNLERDLHKTPIRSFEQVFELAHSMNRIVLRGKYWRQEE